MIFLKVLIFFFMFLLCGMQPTQASINASYTLFESGQVRPLALSKDGRLLYALNTPDNRLEVFSIIKSTQQKKVSLKLIASVVVGLEPVALAIKSHNEIWVVNHLSDSISIVKLNGHQAYVAQTLWVGDEPSDIVFAGLNNNKAFITTAHRGQNHPIEPQLTTPGIGRADVWVFDSVKVNLGKTQPENIITLFTDTPRALTISPDNKRVYAAGFKTGNQTTVIHERLFPDGNLPNTRVDAAGELQPETGLIVKYDGLNWVDENNITWNDKIKFSLPDKDVFIIDAEANPPQLITSQQNYYQSVGTVLFNMITNPVSGNIYVTNTEALNEKRFEGTGERLGRENTLQGNFIRNRISILSPKGSVNIRHLNKHIDYSQCCAPIPNAENALSIAQPLDMAITQDGKTLYVAGFGSQKIAIYDTKKLESDTFTASLDQQISLTGGGPSGLVLDDDRNLLYVLTRFDNAVAVIDLKQRKEIAKYYLYNPEPESVTKGRSFLYDAALTSSHGDASCASCHIFGDMDFLAWDLGDPDATTFKNPGPFLVGPASDRVTADFRALKGPMTTQSLRGMANHGPMHWRGDRAGGNEEPSAQPDSGSFNEEVAFKAFNGAFVGLLGRPHELTDDEMQAFTDFALQITYPPNPIRQLDNNLTESQAAGRDFYFGEVSDTLFNCNGCHTLDINGNKEFGVARPGFFGTSGLYSFDGFTQFFKVAHLRNMYQKVGMFGMAEFTTNDSPIDIFPGYNEFMGEQIKGFGYGHNGAIDTLFRFIRVNGFIFRPETPDLPGNPGGFPTVPFDTPNAEEINAIGDQMRRDVEQFLLAFDSNLAPIVGQQVTLNNVFSKSQWQRIHLLKARAQVNECDLVAFQGSQSYMYDPYNNRFDAEHNAIELFNNFSQSFFTPITFLCAPPGSGYRLAFDRDLDGIQNSIDTHLGK
ncbi:MAG: beta-propeller fold lactonase family protein [Pseudomonadota bacterium]